MTDLNCHEVRPPFLSFLYEKKSFFVEEKPGEVRMAYKWRLPFISSPIVLKDNMHYLAKVVNDSSWLTNCKRRGLTCKSVKYHSPK